MGAGCYTVVYFRCEATVSVPKKDGDREAIEVDYGDIRVAVVVKVTCCDGDRRVPRRDVVAARELAAADVAKHRNGVGGVRDCDEVGSAIAIEVGSRDGDWAACDRIYGLRVE